MKTGQKKPRITMKAGEGNKKSNEGRGRQGKETRKKMKAGKASKRNMNAGKGNEKEKEGRRLRNLVLRKV